MKRFFITTMTAAMLSSFGGAMLQAQTADDHEGKIQQRKEKQQGRIADGVENGSLTAGETANLERKERKVNKEIRNDRNANGGKLTKSEKKQINRQQDKLNHQIYHDKHNASNQAK